MSSLFPHTSYAEDQPFSHELLYFHVVRSSTMMCSFASLFTAPVSLLVSRYRHKSPVNFSTFVPRLLTHSGRGMVFGAALGGLMTWGRMRGREEIEWQDRAWRLLENESQKNTDWTALGGAAAGAVAGAVAARRGVVPFGIGKAALGGAGIGMGIGGPGYMIASSARGREQR
ncbi:hypothetical protein CC78DRAFT_526643 [Lojkania enalia]|uniref:Uncharacterized protein n=1 Tax=Lojkania enalia TaxID=147567 RepID=A0A9P4JX66_9PLEO|nr:hypothetical protein CC78DRAFT_526643 [Didymosphaeria enalia]